VDAHSVDLHRCGLHPLRVWFFPGADGVSAHRQPDGVIPQVQERGRHSQVVHRSWTGGQGCAPQGRDAVAAHPGVDAGDAAGGIAVRGVLPSARLGDPGGSARPAADPRRCRRRGLPRLQGVEVSVT